MKGLATLVEEFRVFEAGNYQETVQMARDAGFVPANIADIARDVSNNPESVCFWSGSTFHTADGIAFSGTKNAGIRKIKFVSGGEFLDMIPTDAELVLGAQPISDRNYDIIKSTEFVKLEVRADVYLDDRFFADLDKCDPFRYISWGQQPWIKVQDFLILAKKIDEKKAFYTIDELYELGAVPMHRNLRLVISNGKVINEASASDAWLALCGYDFHKAQDDEQNQTAKRARDDFVKAIFSLAYGRHIKVAADEAGAMGIRSTYESTSSYLRPLFLGGPSFGLDRCVQTGSFNAPVKLAGKRMQDASVLDAISLARYPYVALKANRGEPFTFSYLTNRKGG